MSVRRFIKIVLRRHHMQPEDAYWFISMRRKIGYVLFLLATLLVSWFLISRMGL